MEENSPINVVSCLPSKRKTFEVDGKSTGNSLMSLPEQMICAEADVGSGLSVKHEHSCIWDGQYCGAAQRNSSFVADSNGTNRPVKA